ncbi:UV radiation resistance-associated protein [Phytophthora cinnamomi]|uniref:UV radiation resistance-associated protein n=1 Tax=Phytophthora cinnamomi TaxID=4785 RepID=UPI00355ABD36|nr:UV radiation resistance-associated protein [Phytophthora cinnamomi]
MMTPSSIAGNFGGAINMTASSLSGFSMRNLSVHGTDGDSLLSVYFKLVVDGRVVYRASGGTRFDIVVVRVHDSKTARRERRKSRSMSDRLSFGDDAPINNSRSFADAKNSFDEADDSGANDAMTDTETPTHASGSNRSVVFEEDILSLSFGVKELEPLPVALTDLTNLPLNTCLFEFSGHIYVHRTVLELLADRGVIAPKHSRRKGSAIPLKDYSLHEGVDALERF